MQQSQRRQQGVTLLEIILVLSISSAILLLSVKQYQSYKLDSDVQQVISNVDQIFQAASYYYQANCRRQVIAVFNSPIPGTGALDPANNPKNPTVIDALTVLYNKKFLPEMIHESPLVLNTGNFLKAYVVQFNLVNSPTMRTVNLSAGGTANVGSVYVWAIQVSVRLRNSATAVQYLNLLRGDCLSRISGLGGQVTPCPAVPAAPGPGDDYVVFTRLPQTATPSSQSGLQATNATVKQFTQQYETMPLQYNISQGGAGQNYLCGP